VPLLAPSITSAGRVQVTLPGDLVYNTDPTAKIHQLEGWWDTVAPEPAMQSIGAPGSVAAGPWVERERYVTISGYNIGVDPWAMRRLLLAGFPPDTDVPVVVTYPDGFAEQMWLRPYDKLGLEPKGQQLRFQLPLVALDPWKYTAQAVAGTMGVFTGDAWFRSYVLDTAPSPDQAYRTYSLDVTPNPDRGYRQHIQAQDPNAAAPALLLTSDGDVGSRRVTVEVTGPLTQGDWHMVNELTGDQLFADLGLVAGQTVVFDCFNQRATLNGTSVDSLVFGDYLSFEPGANTYRLVAGNQSAGFATVTAFAAYK